MVKAIHHSLLTFIVVFIVCINAAAAENLPMAEQLEVAVSDPTRLQEHVGRDDGRKPAEVLALSKIQPGDKVAEIAVGGGYYTALLSRYLGDDGHVYAVDPKLIFDAFPNAKNGFPKYMAADPRDNVSYSIQRFDKFSVNEKLDNIFIVLYYHDTLWTGEDLNAMNQAFFNALKPGGTLFIVDHSAEVGSGVEATKKLHRIDEALVAPEIQKAGFVKIASHDLLRNADDPLTVSVFDENWRGKTDRFIHLYQKPFEDPQ